MSTVSTRSTLLIVLVRTSSASPEHSSQKLSLGARKMGKSEKVGTAHISAAKGDIAEICLVPGDPLRAKILMQWDLLVSG